MRRLTVRRGRRAVTASVALVTAVALSGALAAGPARAADPSPAPATNSTPSPAEPVTPCQQLSAPGVTYPPPPASVPRPEGVEFPAGAAVYGASSTTFAVAPRGWSCLGSGGADGQFALSGQQREPGPPAADGVLTTTSFGGVGVNSSVICGFFPQLRAVIDASTCAVPAARPTAATPLATGTADVYAQLLRFASGAGVNRAAVAGGDAGVSLFLADASPAADGASSADCALPPDQADICAADLVLFLETSVTGRKMAAEQRQRLAEAVVAAVDPAAAEGPEGAEEGKETAECHGHLALALDREIETALSGRAVPVAVNGVGLPAKFPGRVGARASVGELAVCENAVTAAVGTALPTFDGELSLTAKESAGEEDGPFAYSLPQLRWVGVPGAPPGQRLTTEFTRVGTSFEVNPSLVLAFAQKSSGGVPAPEVALSLMSFQLKAIRRDVTLVRRQAAFLEAGVGPVLALDVLVSKSDLEEAAEDAEASGESAATAIADTAEQASADAAAGVFEEALNFFDVTLDQATLKAGYDQLDGEVIDGLKADPAIPTDAELAGESAADAAAADETAFAGVDGADAAALRASSDVAVDAAPEFADLVEFAFLFL